MNASALRCRWTVRRACACVLPLQTYFKHTCAVYFKHLLGLYSKRFASRVWCLVTSYSGAVTIMREEECGVTLEAVVVKLKALRWSSHYRNSAISVLQGWNDLHVPGM